MHEPLFNLKHILAFGVVMLVIGVFVGAIFFKKTIVAREGTADTPAAMSAVNLMIDYGTGTIKTWNTVSWHEAQSVLTLMQEVAATKNITLETTSDAAGVLSIDGTENSSEGDLLWQYWVNNSYQPVPANKYYLKPGDIVVWKYVSEQKK